MVPPQKKKKMYTKKGDTTNGRLSEGTSDAWISWSAGEWAATRREPEVTNIVGLRYSSFQYVGLSYPENWGNHPILTIFFRRWVGSTTN